MSDLVPEPASGAASTVKNAFTRKIGPLPGFVWVLLIVGAAYGYRWYRGRNGSTVVNAAGDTGATDYSTAPVTSGGGAGFGGTGIASTPQGTSVPDNASWSSQVLSALVSSGGDPSVISNALAKYLAGSPLSAAEQAVINEAIRKFGPPPNGVLPVSSAPPPKVTVAPKYSVRNPPPGTRYIEDAARSNTLWQEWPDGSEHYVSQINYAFLGKPKYTRVNVPKPSPPKPAPKAAPKHTAPKPSPRTYTVKSGDSLFSIAQHFYGNGNSYTKIYNANKSVIGSNPSVIHVGTRLVIPT